MVRPIVVVTSVSTQKLAKNTNRTATIGKEMARIGLAGNPCLKEYKRINIETLILTREE